MDIVSCVVCGSRPPVRGLVCEPDRARIASMLAGLPARMRQLALQLVPSAGPGAGGKTPGSRTGSPTGARLDALTLTGPGSNRVTASTAMLHPLVRKWHVTRTMHVTVEIGGKKITSKQQVTSWFSELVRDGKNRPVYLAHDDQTGVLPPGEWLGLWASRWVSVFGHSMPVTAKRRSHGGPKTPAHAANTFMATMAASVARQKATDLLTGLTSRLPASLRPDDPLADEWELRFGEPGRDSAAAVYTDYLLTWFDHACRDPKADIAAFAAELRALSDEIARVLGEQPDQQWLGRCPAVLSYKEAGSKVCGAGLWQDPWASQVSCPRCRSTWGPAKVMLLALAIAIRETWPVDRRRRYSSSEIAELGECARLACPTCTKPVSITWRNVTEPADKTHFWQPAAAVCPDGHPEAKGLI